MAASAPYQVVARRYRPQRFDELVGQEHVARGLSGAIESGRIGHAYLFTGARGVGKTSAARIYAKALECERGPAAEPCNACDTCAAISAGQDVDVVEIDAASNRGVDEIRQLRQNVAVRPARGRFKVYIIDEVHMLTREAFNALLKTLEEPPPHVKFIFATTEAQKLPATITSRCQRFDLRRIPAELIAKHLNFIAGSENIRLDPAAADAIARGAEGGLRDAESMLDQMVAFCGDAIAAQDVMDVFGFTSRETVTGLADNIFARDAAAALGIVAEQSEAGKDLSRLTSELVGHLRDLLVSAASGQATAAPQGKLLDLIEHFSEAETRMRWVADKKLQLDVAVIKALHLLDETSLSDVIETLASLSSGEIPPVSDAPQAPRRPAPAPEPAPRPAPAREPAKPLPTAAPAAAAPAARPDPEDAGVSAATVWEAVAEEFAKDSFIRFGWLREGGFERFEGGAIFLRFPGSSREASESMWMEKGLKDLEARLTRELGQTVRLAFEFDETIFTPPEPEPEPERREPSAPAAPPQPPADPMEEFKADPLIRKALEVFKSTL